MSKHIPDCFRYQEYHLEWRLHAERMLIIPSAGIIIHTRNTCRASLYPERFKRDGNAAEGDAEMPMVRFADVGCGFGGLLIRLSPLYTDKLMVGFELRDKVDIQPNRIRMGLLNVKHDVLLILL